METTKEQVKEFTQSDFAAQVLKSGQPVLVDFWAPWCGPCRMQGPILHELAEQVGEKAVIGKVNTDEEYELAEKYGISSIPSLLVFKGGKPVKSFVGVTSAADLKKALLG